MIVNIRGTHGSGKSTVVKKILDRYGFEAESYIEKRGGKRPANYIVQLPGVLRPLYIIGCYETSCGGCDGIQPYSEIWPRIVSFANRGHVLLEGALVSSSYGNIGRASECYGDDFVFAFMDTPLKKCIRQIEQRRAANGNTKPLNPDNTIKKHEAVARSIDKIRNEFKRKVVIINHKKAVSQVVGLFHG